MNPKKPRNNCRRCGKQCKHVNGIYCSTACQQALQRELAIQAWLKGEYSGTNTIGNVRPFIKNYLIELRGHRCERCANEKWLDVLIPLEAHHVDGDHKNDKPDNLMLLCPNCHAITESYRGKNRGNGRKQRNADVAKR